MENLRYLATPNITTSAYVENQELFSTKKVDMRLHGEEVKNIVELS